MKLDLGARSTLDGSVVIKGRKKSMKIYKVEAGADYSVCCASPSSSSLLTVQDPESPKPQLK